jgi:hypothetical protein
MQARMYKFHQPWLYGLEATAQDSSPPGEQPKYARTGTHGDSPT